MKLNTGLAIALLLAFFGVAVAVKQWQYKSCIGDGLSPGTCLGMISR